MRTTYYSPERKSSIVKRLLPPERASVSQLSKQEGIAESTLYNWRLKAMTQGMPMNKEESSQWNAEARFAVIVETATLSASELSEYCRRNTWQTKRYAGNG